MATREKDGARAPHANTPARNGRAASPIGRDPASQPLSEASLDLIAREKAFGARNYDPLPVVLARGNGSWVADVDGHYYLDLMSAYSAVSFGHAHPRIVGALVAQAHQLGVTSRAYYNDELPTLLERLAQLTGLDRALPANGGAEAVETAIKAARKWGHKIKGIPEGRAEIIGCAGNFHGRTIAVVGLSTEPQYRDGFGPFPPGLSTIPYGDADALAKAITPRTAAFLVEPIQGEGGIIVPPPRYLARCREICRENRVLMICDEIQTGLGRTGRFLASEHEGVKPDGVILGKALGGGLLPVSAFVATNAVMQVFHPGDHGSTFGGNPLAAAVAMAALDVLFEEKLIERSAELGAWLLSELQDLRSHIVSDVRGRGLFVGIEVDARYTTARPVVDRLLARGILSKDTHGTVVRIAPPLNIPRDDLEWAVREIRAVFRELERDLKRAA
ncbi:MAG TPA: ornithine--oxo-acid transaminase [Casimicrobiaceae bacterium]|jgi:ornithine--oxo-acid transaminase|nr:ornithine--oxo-acid transaminase [Casimicrobiaceae bacterium]